MCGQWGKTGAYFAYDLSKVRSLLKLEIIDRIVDELRPLGLKLIDIEGGETLLYPCFEELLERMQGKNLYVKFATNGTLLEKFARTIVESSVKSITVSIDGEKETHNQIRGREWAYDKTIDGLRALSEVKKSSGKETPLVQIAFTMNRNNGAAALRNLCRDLKGKGLTDVLEIKLTPIFIPEQAETKYKELVRRYFDVGEGILSPSGFRDDYSDFIHQGYEIAQVVSRLKREPLDFFIEALPHIPLELIPRLYLDYSWELGRGPCPVPFDEPTIDADGNVYPCNLFTDASLSMGNVYEGPFLPIWDSSNFMKFRKMLMDQGGLLPICNRCCQLTEY